MKILNILYILTLFLICGCATNKALPDSMNEDSHFTPADIEHYKKLADDGDVSAAVRLSDYYGECKGDMLESKKWLRKAANLGDPESQYNLSIVLSESTSKPEQDEATLWLKKSAQAG
jgi:TPR repeat protein